jgi:hypothetical protein
MDDNLGDDEKIDFSLQFSSPATDILSVGFEISSDATSSFGRLSNRNQREIGAIENSREIGIRESKGSF